MNSADLYAAAAKIKAGADKRREWARQTPALGRLFLGVAQQLDDRAEQVRSWAANSAHLERRGETRDADQQINIETATREFLAMARG